MIEDGFAEVGPLVGLIDALAQAYGFGKLDDVIADGVAALETEMLGLEIIGFGTGDVSVARGHGHRFRNGDQSGTAVLEWIFARCRRGTEKQVRHREGVESFG